jgi:chaperonin GroES
LKSNLRPLNKRVIAKRVVDSQGLTPGGLFIPDAAKETPTEGIILAFDSECNQHLQEGDRILFGKYSGADVTIDGQEYLILREDEILAVIEPDAN